MSQNHASVGALHVAPNLNQGAVEMKLVSLSSAVHLWPDWATQPLAVVALLGEVGKCDNVVPVEAVAAVPVRGGFVRFDQPVRVVLTAATVAAMQAVDLPAQSPATGEVRP